MLDAGSMILGGREDEMSRMIERPVWQSKVKPEVGIELGSERRWSQADGEEVPR
jgi:hypothetical protein